MSRFVSGRHGGVEKRGGRKTSRRTPLPKTGFGPPPLCLGHFLSPSGVVALLSCTENLIQDSALPKLFWRGPKIFWRGSCLVLKGIFANFFGSPGPKDFPGRTSKIIRTGDVPPYQKFRGDPVLVRDFLFPVFCHPHIRAQIQKRPFVHNPFFLFAIFGGFVRNIR